MAKVTFEQKTLDINDGASVLETLLDAGFDIPNACRAGACHSCLMQAVDGQPPEDAQQGLKDSQQAQKFFLACCCHPETDLVVALPHDEDVRITCKVTHKAQIAGDILEVRLAPQSNFSYQGGQYITLWKDHHDGRSYSLASVPGLDDELILHIREIPGGALSQWLQDKVNPNDMVDIQGPSGDCFYSPGEEDKPLLLVGTSTGLAPLYGILRDALKQGHSGPIYLFHGALDASGLYLVETLQHIAATNEQVHYYPSVVKGEAAEGIQVGLVDELVMQTVPDLKDFRVYLCGAPELVEQLKKQVFLKGASMSRIYADPFLPPSNAK